MCNILSSNLIPPPLPTGLICSTSLRHLSTPLTPFLFELPLFLPLNPTPPHRSGDNPFVSPCPPPGLTFLQCFIQIWGAPPIVPLPPQEPPPRSFAPNRYGHYYPPRFPLTLPSVLLLLPIWKVQFIPTFFHTGDFLFLV